MAIMYGRVTADEPNHGLRPELFGRRPVSVRTSEKEAGSLPEGNPLYGGAGSGRTLLIANVFR